MAYAKSSSSNKRSVRDVVKSSVITLLQIYLLIVLQNFENRSQFKAVVTKAFLNTLCITKIRDVRAELTSSGDLL